jgi:hypothetical protein
MSKVKLLVQSVLQRNEALPDHFKDRRVTLRLSGLEYAALAFVASRMEGTPTGTAQDLLSEAIQEAIEALGYESFSDAFGDIVSYYDDIRAIVDEGVPA